MSDSVIFDVGQIRANLSRIHEATKAEVARGMFEEGILIQNVSMENTPFREGTTRASHITLEPEEDQSGDIVVRVQAGGPAAPQALAIHEHLSEHSPPSWVKAEESGQGVHFNVGGPKFLENAANAAITGFEARLAARVDSNRIEGA